MARKRVFVDLDGVLANYEGGSKIYQSIFFKGKIITRDITIRPGNPGFFLGLSPMPDALGAFRRLTKKFEVHILSTAPWSNTHSWSEKRVWVEKHLGRSAFKKLTLTHRKDLLMGDYLIDDRLLNGAAKFKGEHIHFGSKKFPNWKSILKYLKA